MDKKCKIFHLKYNSMEAIDKGIIFLFFALLLLVGFTLYNIFSFMPVINACEDEFAITERCKCLPCDSDLVQFFEVEKSCEEIKKSPLEPQYE